MRARLAGGALLALAACGPLGREPDTGWTLSAAGDISSCWWGTDEQTARLLDRTDGLVLALGDNVYQDGTASQYRQCYGPTWGRHLSRTWAVIGNHDERTDEGAPYYAYFGAAAGPAGRGWYSRELAGWHVVALNSEVPMGEGSEQLAWLRRDLAASRAKCTLVLMHRPRFSSGEHGPSARTKPAFRVMREHGVDLLLGAHDHHYERFAPQDSLGRADPAGVRQFVVGTGGAPSYALGARAPNSEAVRARVHGILRLRLRDGAYDWEFLPTARHRFRDAGSGRCV